MQARMGRALVGDIVGSLLTAFVLAHVIGWAEATTVLQGLGWSGCFSGWVLSWSATIHTVTYERKTFWPIRIAQWLPVDFPCGHECHTGSLALSQAEEKTDYGATSAKPSIDELRAQVVAHARVPPQRRLLQPQWFSRSTERKKYISYECRCAHGGDKKVTWLQGLWLSPYKPFPTLSSGC